MEVASKEVSHHQEVAAGSVLEVHNYYGLGWRSVPSMGVVNELSACIAEALTMCHEGSV